MTTEELLKITDREVGRARSPGPFGRLGYAIMSAPLDGIAGEIMAAGGGQVVDVFANMTLVTKNRVLNVQSLHAVTIGHTVFIASDAQGDIPLLAHEYIHTLQEESGGIFDAGIYGIRAVVQASYGREAAGPGNRTEAIAYLWQQWTQAFRPYGELAPWHYYRPLFGPVPRV